MCTIATSNSNNKREGRGGGREQQENNNNNNAAKQNYNQIRILIYFWGFWFWGGDLWCSQNWQSSTRRRFSQIGIHPQDEVLAKLAILHKEKS
jgi:hypothetical protein